jgi:hypothetical protein
VFQHTLAESWVLLLVGEQLENYPYEHSMVEHVDVCPLSDALMGNCLSSLDQVGSRMGRVFELCRRVTATITTAATTTRQQRRDNDDNDDNHDGDDNNDDDDKRKVTISRCAREAQ